MSNIDTKPILAYVDFAEDHDPNIRLEHFKSFLADIDLPDGLPREVLFELNTSSLLKLSELYLPHDFKKFSKVQLRDSDEERDRLFSSLKSIGICCETNVSSKRQRISSANDVRGNTSQYIANEPPIRTTILQWLEQLSGFADLKRSPPVRFAEATFPRRLDRDEAMKAIYTHFADVIQSHATHAPRKPIISVSAAPGCGKTYFLDEVGALRDDDIDRFCQSDILRTAFRSALAISVSYNSRTGHQGDRDHGSFGLCVRMLFSYFHSILPIGMTFGNFFTMCCTLDSSALSPSSCVTSIAEHFTAISSAVLPTLPTEPLLVILLVDEASKSDNENHVLQIVGSILDEPPRYSNDRQCRLLPVFTSLARYQFVKDCMTSSQRTILPIPLSVPLRSAPAALKDKLQLAVELYPLIDVLCRDVGYHGRMLEAIASILAPGTMHRNLVNCRLDAPFQCLKTIHTALLQHKLSASFFSHLAQLSLTQAVCAALLGFTINREAKISTVAIDQHSDWTYENLQSHGVFIDDAGDTEGNIIPVMSPLQLVYWANKQDGLPENKDDQLKKCFFKQIMRTLSSETFYNWQTFERFHSDVELLRRYAYWFYGLNSASLKTFYCLDDWDRSLSSAPAPSLSSMMNFASATLSPLPSHATHLYSQVRSVVVSHAVDVGTVELAAESQPFYDIRIVQPIIGRSIPMNIFLQCKWSVDPEQRDKDVRSWLEHTQLIVDDPNVVFVYVASRHIPNLRGQDSLHPSNVILLDHKALKRFYGPTLMLAHAMSATILRFGELLNTD